MTGGPPEVDLSAFALIGLLALVAGVAVLWLRSRRPGTAEGAIQVLALRPLGGKRLLALVEVERERFLLGLTDENIACLGRLEVPGARAGLRSVPASASGGEGA